MVIYSDDSIVVVNKPAGVPVLPDGWETDAPYLVKQLEEQFGRLWVVHRLDKVTSGVMVFARTAAAHRTLNLQFERRETHKAYHAIVVGNPKWDEHTLSPFQWGHFYLLQWGLYSLSLTAMRLLTGHDSNVLLMSPLQKG